VESVMTDAERLSIPYLFKLRQTRNVKQLTGQLFNTADWEDAGQGWTGIDSTLRLQGWSRSRRVVVLRRRLQGDVALIQRVEPQQLLLSTVEKSWGRARCMSTRLLITNRSDPILALAQL